MNMLFYGDSHDPWRNLAAEEVLFDAPGAGMTLFLWQNANTVVIGRHQNAWRECRASLLEAEHGKLARRTTGGGAVYHDLGNLNFTFVCPREQYDLARQTGVILEAVRGLGVDAAFTGRNDIVTAGGAKFSGNAFRFSKAAAMQHGTLLVSADMEKLSRYLAPSPEKLRAKGVASVRARVANLCEFGAHIDVSSVREAVRTAFLAEYGAYELREVQSLDPAKLGALYERNASWAWRMGAAPAFDVSFETRFAWGGVELMLSLRHGTVEHATCFTDAMDADLGQRVAGLLVGSVYEPAALAQRLVDSDIPEDRDIAAWLAVQEL